jgi:anti-sigma B factor antagonist
MRKPGTMSYLNCPRCGFSVMQRTDPLAWRDCPRCLGRDDVAVGLQTNDHRQWSTSDPHADPADDVISAHPESPSGAPLVIGRRSDADGWVLTLHGELDLSSVSMLRDAMNEIEQIGFRRLVLNLDDVSFMDSTGVAAIVAADLRARRSDKHLTLICRGQVKRLLRLTGVDRDLNFSGSVSPARCRSGESIAA